MSTLLVGFILGFVISIPLGPLGAYMIATMQKRGFWAGLTIGLFDALVDTFFCGLSLFGMTLVINIPVLRFIIQITGLIILLYLGGRHLFSSRDELLGEGKIESLAQKALKTNKFILHFKNAFIVFIFALSNPTRWAFWVNAASLLHTFVLPSARAWQYFAFSVSVGFGAAICQYLVLRFIQKAHRANNQFKIIIRWAGSFIFTITIICLGIQILKELVTVVF